MQDADFAATPLIEWFAIIGLHGYKNVAIEFRGKATVVVAENGTGKTTLFNALNAFLTRRFHRLNSLDFQRIECKFKDDPYPLVLPRDAIGANETNVELLQSSAQKINISPDELLDYAIGQYRPEHYQALKYQDGIANALWTATPGDGAKSVLDSLHKTYSSTLTSYVKELGSLILEKVGKSEIIYLPTYRRVEKPLLRASRREGATATSLFETGSKKSSNTYQGITFGLGDIEARLAELSEEIERQSNFGYRYSSARILQDMSKGRSATLHREDDKLPDIETLTLFLGRIGKTDKSLQEVLSNIRKLYESDDIGNAEFEHLRYFLYRINQVAEETKFLEQRIEHFVAICNSYLQMSSDEKKLSFDPATLKVAVENEWTHNTVPLDELSSGEKQIVSLMAKLYLYPGEKIILIDEPELSLSLEWQKRVLPDLLRAGNITQLLAITHSPFIFDNELDEFTSPLHVSRSEV